MTTDGKGLEVALRNGDIGIKLPVELSIDVELVKLVPTDNVRLVVPFPSCAVTSTPQSTPILTISSASVEFSGARQFAQRLTPVVPAAHTTSQSHVTLTQDCACVTHSQSALQLETCLRCKAGWSW